MPHGICLLSCRERLGRRYKSVPATRTQMPTPGFVRPKHPHRRQPEAEPPHGTITNLGRIARVFRPPRSLGCTAALLVQPRPKAAGVVVMASGADVPGAPFTAWVSTSPRLCRPSPAATPPSWRPRRRRRRRLRPRWAGEDSAPSGSAPRTWRATCPCASL